MLLNPIRQQGTGHVACQLLYLWLLAFAIFWLHLLVSLLASLIYYMFIQTWGQASVASSKKVSFQILELLFSNNWVVDFLHKVQCDAKHYILIRLSVHCCIPISGPEWALGVICCLKAPCEQYHSRVCNYYLQKALISPILHLAQVDFHRTSTEVYLVSSLRSYTGIKAALDSLKLFTLLLFHKLNKHCVSWNIYKDMQLMHD